MKPSDNIEQEILNWRKREEALSKLFPPAVLSSRSFQVEKLQRLDFLFHSLARDTPPPSRMILSALKIERDQLELKLYPKLMQRLLRRLANTSRKEAKDAAIQQKRAQNLEEIASDLKKFGIANVDTNSIQQQMAKDLSAFTVVHLHTKTPERATSVAINFSKTMNGHYEIIQYTGMQQSADGLKDKTSVSFSLASYPSINSHQVFNLLEGRVVQVEKKDLAGNNQLVWESVDITDKDPNGDYKHRTHNINPESFKKINLLNSYGLNEKDIAGIIQHLKNGDAERIVIGNEDAKQEISVTLNARTGKVEFFNEKGKTITIDAVAQSNTNTAKQIVSENKTKKNNRTHQVFINDYNPK